MITLDRSNLKGFVPAGDFEKIVPQIKDAQVF